MLSMHWHVWLGVALGGASGACARYGLSVLLAAQAGRWPLATLLANLLGCFLAGYLSTLLARQGSAPGVLAIMTTVGFLGAFTTFSAFSVEVLRLYESAAVSAALAHVLANVVGALLMVTAGAFLARLH